MARFTNVCLGVTFVFPPLLHVRLWEPVGVG
jgi:hypothetical protein